MKRKRAKQIIVTVRILELKKKNFGISHTWMQIMFWSFPNIVALRTLFNPLEYQAHGQYKCNW